MTNRDRAQELQQKLARYAASFALGADSRVVHETVMAALESELDAVCAERDLELARLRDAIKAARREAALFIEQRAAVEDAKASEADYEGPRGMGKYLRALAAEIRAEAPDAG
jgi:hypothetical protein